MKALALFLLVFVSVSTASAQPVVVIVRHAEKAANGGNDPDLSSAGRARAEALARILKDSSITAIFTSEFKRTQETAAPAATLIHVTPTVVAAKDTAALVGKLHQLNGNGLVVGHGAQFRTSSKRLESIARSTFLTRITRSCSSSYLAISQSCFDCIIRTVSGVKMGSRSENGVISKLGRF